MTTKPILTEGSADFTECKKAGKKLYQQLKNQGFELTGVGVGISGDRTALTIHIMLHHKPGTPKIPTEFEGFEVDLEITGDIQPLSDA
jgi:hypothetical protein